MERYKIAKKFGKGIVNSDGVQVAWVDDYVMAKSVCMFLNGGSSDYPEYVKVNGVCYKLKGDIYWSDRLGISLDFTVSGGDMYSVSSFDCRDGMLLVKCDIEDWLVDVRDYI